jgi:hypothetical protein
MTTERVLGAHIHRFSDGSVLVNPWLPGVDHPMARVDAFLAFKEVFGDD